MQICKMMLSIQGLPGNAPCKCCSICRGCSSQSKMVLLNSAASGRSKLQTLHFPEYAQTLEEEAIWLSYSTVCSCTVPFLRSYGYCKQQAMVEIFAIYCLGADMPCRFLRGDRDAVATIYFSPLLFIPFLLDFASPACVGRGKKNPLEFGR